MNKSADIIPMSTYIIVIVSYGQRHLCCDWAADRDLPKMSYTRDDLQYFLKDYLVMTAV